MALYENPEYYRNPDAGYDEDCSVIYPYLDEVDVTDCLTSTELPRLHQYLKDHLEDLEWDDDLTMVFYLTTYLTDPYLQPEENDDVILSLDCLADVLLALTFKYYVRSENSDLKDADCETVKFAISTKFFIILRLFNRFLLMEDELGLKYCKPRPDNYDAIIDFFAPLRPYDKFTMRLVYMGLCLLIKAIYKCFSPPNDDDYNMALNPYTNYFLRLWKCNTNICELFYKLEYSVRWRNKLKTVPEVRPITRTMFRGCSAIRVTLAWVLNQNPSGGYWDEFLPTSSKVGADKHKKLKSDIFTNDTLLNLWEPLVRLINVGSGVRVDLGMLAISEYFLTAGSLPLPMWEKINKSEFVVADADEAAMQQRRLNRELNLYQLSDLIADISFGDNLDDCILDILELDLKGLTVDDEKYPFEFNEEDDEDLNYDYEYDEEDDMEDPHDDIRQPVLPVRILGEEAIEIDKYGRDWRDHARGGNIGSTEKFLKYAMHPENKIFFLQSWDDLEKVFRRMLLPGGGEDLLREEGKRAILTIAMAIRAEEMNQASDITPDKIYEYWTLFAEPSVATQYIERTTAVSFTYPSSSAQVMLAYPVTNLEVMLLFHTQLTCKLMDEMFMCTGYRRTLVWYLTNNINYSSLLLNYIFELLTDLRGQDNQDGLDFTRKGDHVILSKIESLMFLHLLFANIQTSLSMFNDIPNIGNLRFKKFVEVLCLMILKLITKGVIELRPHEEDKDNDKDTLENGEDSQDEKDVLDEESLDDYGNDLLSLLVSWISIPVARELYFAIRKKIYGSNEDTELEPEPVPVPEKVYVGGTEKLLKKGDKKEQISKQEQEELKRRKETEQINFEGIRFGDEWDKYKLRPQLQQALEFIGEVAATTDSWNSNDIYSEMLQRSRAYIKENFEGHITREFPLYYFLQEVLMQMTVKYVPEKAMPMPQGFNHWDTIRMFFECFNELSYFLEFSSTYFGQVDHMITNPEVPEISGKSKKRLEESMESEFNDKFLNGELEYPGQLLASINGIKRNQNKPSNKKKKKKKKKSKHK